MKILFTGGGTGGHVLPIIAITREIRRIYPKDHNPSATHEPPPSSPRKNDLEFYYIGPKDDFGKILLSQEDIKVKEILAGKIRRYLNWKSFLQNLTDILFKIPAGILQSFFYIFFFAPDLIFSKGGYGSLPVLISGWILQVPIFLHESDVSPGLTNKFSAKLSLEVFVSFPKTEYFSPERIILIGNPIRREILEGNLEKAKNFFKLSGEKPVILILGGSQGAQRINDVILQILPDILINFEVLHQAGEKNFKQIQAEAKMMISSFLSKSEEKTKDLDLEKYYHIFPFLKEVEIKQAYQSADLIVNRAGSGSIFEIAAVGKPSILIPLPEAAQNHQVKNAYSYAEKGACVVMEENNFTPHFFLEKLKYLFSHPEELKKMTEAAKDFAKPQAAKIIAGYILDYLTI